MSCAGSFFKIVGALTAIANGIYFLYCFFNSQYFELKFIDFDGQKIDYKVDLSGLAFIAIFKAITGVIMYKLGKKLHGVFRPILKDYRNAERGITQGIQMTKRISKDMTDLGYCLRRVYGMCCCLNFLMGFVFIAWACDQAGNYLDMKYAFMAQQRSNDSSMSNFTVPAIPAAPIFDESEDLPKNADEIASSWWQPPMLDKDGYFDLSKLSVPVGEQPIEFNQGDLDDAWKETGMNFTALFRHKKHHGHHARDSYEMDIGAAIRPFYARLQEMPQQEALDTIQSSITFLVICGVLYGNFWLGIMILIFWIPIKRARRAQRKLE